MFLIRRIRVGKPFIQQVIKVLPVYIVREMYYECYECLKRAAVFTYPRSWQPRRKSHLSPISTEKKKARSVFGTFFFVFLRSTFSMRVLLFEN